MWILQTILIIIFCLYLPGALILRLLQVRDSHSPHFIAATCTGMAAFLLTSYALAYARFPSFMMLYFGISSAWYLGAKQWHSDLIALKRLADPLILSIIAFGTLCFILLNISSGIVSNNGYELRVTNARDGVLHLALAKTMADTFPPQRPGLAGTPLEGYHYFYPFLASRLNNLFSIPVEDLLFRIMATIFAILWGASFYLLSSHYSNKRSARALVTVYAYLGYGTLPLLPAIGYPGMQYPLTLVHNPSTILAVALLLTGWYAWLNIKQHRGWILIAALNLGVLAQIKVYAGIIGIVSTVSYTVYLLFTNLLKKTKPVFSIPHLSALAVCALITYLTFYIHNAGSATLVWAPLRYLDHFMEQTSLNHWTWALRKQIFLDDSNYLRIAIMYLQAGALFFAFHLGNRILIFASAKKLFSKAWWTNADHVLLISAFTLMISLPLLTIQSVAVFDIGQFLWIASAISALPVGIAAANLWHKPWAKLLVCLVILIPAALGYRSDFISYQLREPSTTIPTQQYQIYQFAYNQTTGADTIVYIPINPKTSSFNEGIPINSALTARRIFYEPELTPFRESGEKQSRQQLLTSLAKNLTDCDPTKFFDNLSDTNSKNILVNGQICQEISKSASQQQETSSLSFYSF